MELIYKNLKGTLEKVAVTDAEVDRQLTKLQQQTPRVRPITDRAAQAGDEVVLDYAGSVDGVPFEGGTAQGQTLRLGSGMFIPGFEDQLIGHKPGDSVTVRVTFPKDYRAAELAGKDAEFACTVHEVRERTPYALDDTFAKEVGQCENYAEMREKMRQSLREFYDERAEMELQDRLMRQAAATLDFTPTDDEIREAVDAQLQTVQAQLAQRGLTLEQYCQFTGSTMDQLRSDARPEAEMSLRIQKTAERIAALEGLQETEAELAQEYAAVCRQNGVTMEQLKPYVTDEFDRAVRQNARLKKAINFVRAHAEVTEKPAQPIKE